MKHEKWYKKCEQWFMALGTSASHRWSWINIIWNSDMFFLAYNSNHIMVRNIWYVVHRSASICMHLLFKVKFRIYSTVERYIGRVKTMRSKHLCVLENQADMLEVLCHLRSWEWSFSNYLKTIWCKAYAMPYRPHVMCRKVAFLSDCS